MKAYRSGAFPDGFHGVLDLGSEREHARARDKEMRRGAPAAQAAYLEEVTVGGEDGDGTVVTRHGCVRGAD